GNAGGRNAELSAAGLHAGDRGLAALASAEGRGSGAWVAARVRWGRWRGEEAGRRAPPCRLREGAAIAWQDAQAGRPPAAFLAGRMTMTKSASRSVRSLIALGALLMLVPGIPVGAAAAPTKTWSPSMGRTAPRAAPPPPHARRPTRHTIMPPPAARSAS